jgi:hypothetical protein
MTNHIPVIGIVIGLAILVFALVWRSTDLKRFALIYFVALGLMTVVVYLTGEPAEEAIEHMAGISESAIEKHEDASLAGLIGIRRYQNRDRADQLKRRTKAVPATESILTD